MAAGLYALSGVEMRHELTGSGIRGKLYSRLGRLQILYQTISLLLCLLLACMYALSVNLVVKDN